MQKNTNTQNIPVLVICAPTACGKTDLAYNLFASKSSCLFNKAEIVSADSMQVYKHMNIGTAKPSKDFLKELPHHIIDMCEPSCQFGVGDFVRHAGNAVTDIYSRGKLPVLLGGTAFYIKNFVYGLPTTPRVDNAVRIHIEERMKIEGAEKLWNELNEFDSISAEKIHINDEYRIKRALEVYYSTGLPRSSFLVEQKFVAGYRFLLINLLRTRHELYERVEKRVEIMFEQGLEQEVQNLHHMGYTQEDPGMQAIGYREFFLYDNIDEIKERIIKNTKEYVKRQQTFFKSFEHALSIDITNFSFIEEKIHEFVNS